MPSEDFSTGSFTTRREPLKDLNTFSDLYIDSDEESERIMDKVHDIPDDSYPLPPPPPEMDPESNNDPSNSVTSMIERLSEWFTSLEDQLTDLSQRVSENVPLDELENRCKLIKDRMTYWVQRECDKVKKQLELLVQELGQSVVDCLKRRDRRIDQRFQSLLPSASTPDPKSTLSFFQSKQRNVTYSMQSSHLTSQGNQTTMQYNPPVKLDFPSFSSTQEDDPVVFIEHCEEYFAVRPLSEGEILASLSAVLKGTPKDWWMAERRNVQNWRQFKESFLHSFLSEDYDDVAARKLLERRQGARESIRDFAFHYRALCLRWRKGMSEKEVVQAILRNCNPRLASLLRGTIKDVGELVRIGTQIERDFDESKRYWSQANGEEQRKKASTVQEPPHKPPNACNRVVQSFQSALQHDYKNITLPIILQDRYVSAMVDTGSTFSLIQESFWKQLGPQEQYQSSEG